MSTRNFVVKNGLTVGNVTIDAASGNLVTTNANLGNLAKANYFQGDGGLLSNINGANITGNISGNITNANYAAFAGNITVGAQPNITSVGTLNALSVTANVSAGGIKTDNLYYSNGTPWDFQLPGGSNTQVQFNDNGDFGGSANFTFDKSTSVLTITGNIAGGNIAATGAVTGATANFSGNLNAGNVTVGGGSGGSITGANSISANYFSGDGSALSNIAGANVTGQVGNALVAGTVYTAAQPNITSVGTLANLSVSGNASAGNLSTGGTLSVTGNANVGNIGATAGVFTGNVSANNLSATNQVTAGNGLQVTTGALSVLAGNLDVTGNLNVTGNVNYSNVTDLVVGDPLIYLGANNTGDTYDLGLVGSYNEGTYYHTGIARNAADNYWTFFDGVVAEPTTVIDWANAVYPTVKMGNLISTTDANIGGNLVVTGNANVGNIGATNAVFTNVSGNGANLTSITGANVTGYVANADHANVADSANSVAGANVTGQVAYANVANNVAGSNVSGEVAFANVANSVAGANVTGQVAYANVANNVAGGNVSGQVGNALVAGTVYTAAQPNITSVGTLSSLSVSGNANVGNLAATGNVEATYFIGNGSQLTGIDATAIQNGSANVRTFNNGNVTISAAGTANVVVVTSAGADVTGNLTAGNISGNGAGLSSITGANVTGTVANATYATSAGTAGTATSATTAGTVTTAAQPNITSVGTLANLSVTGNISAGNVDGGNLVSANYVSGTLITAAQPNITSVGSLTSLDVTGNVTANYVSTVGFSSDRANVSVSTGTVIDQFAPSTFRTAKYVISASGDDGYQSVETLLVHDGVDAYITIYGSICSNIASDIIDVTANINGTTGNVSLYATAGGANVKVNVVASYIKT